MLARKRFQRRFEDFICQNCGAEVKGNGYTDHCPICLWGKHVDLNPGDRASNCGGMMEPMQVYKKGSVYVIAYICQKCGHEFRVKAAENDNFEALIELSKNLKQEI